mgnify:FL=1
MQLNYKQLYAKITILFRKSYFLISDLFLATILELNIISSTCNISTKWIMNKRK